MDDLKQYGADKPIVLEGAAYLPEPLARVEADLSRVLCLIQDKPSLIYTYNIKFIGYLLLATVAMAMLCNQGAFRTNLFAIRETASFFSLSPETLNDVYWDSTYNWGIDTAPAIEIRNSATDGEVMISVLKVALQGDGEQVLAIGRDYVNACLRRPSCRMVYTRAAFVLNREDIIQLRVLDDELWRTLAGNEPPRVRTKEELASYQQYYESLLPLFPNKPELFYILGSINRTMGGWDKALYYFNEAFILAPHNSRYKCYVGEALSYSNTSPNRGLELCREAIQHTPDDMWLYEIAGRLYARHNRCNEAQDVYEKATLRFPDRAEPSVWLTNFHSGQTGECTAD